MEGRNREVEKTVTVACNGSFLSGVVQVGRKQRGKGGGGGRSVGFLFTLQRLNIHASKGLRGSSLRVLRFSAVGVAHKWLIPPVYAPVSLISFLESKNRYLWTDT